jgi:predicted regulator of Ras-like GTPase activity (Roadblock/LC7/MglB family)
MDKKMSTPEATPPQSFAQIMRQLHQEGGFHTAVLTSKDGLTIAAAPQDYNNDTVAAIVALLQRTSNDAQSILGMAELDEVTLYDHNHMRLICRLITFAEKSFILAVIVPSDRSYRRLMSWAVKHIETLLAA